jgi:hypothetical protein
VNATQQLSSQKYQDTKEYQDKLMPAQAAFAKTDLTPKAAGAVAEKFGVLTEDVLKGGKVATPLVTINQKQETAESSKVGEMFGTEYGTLQKSAVESGATLAKLDRMSQLMDGVQTGKLTPAITQVQALGESLGITVDKNLPAKQALEALSNEIALTLRNPSGGAGMPGAMSDKDREFLQSMTPGIGKTQEGNRLIIETAKSLAKRSQHVAKMARAYRKKNGHFDEGFFDELQTYSDAHPLFAGKTPVPSSSSTEGGGWSIKPMP